MHIQAEAYTHTDIHTCADMHAHTITYIIYTLITYM